MAKAEKQAVARQYEDGDLFGGDGQLGTGPGCLLQSCSADEVSLLTGQVCASTLSCWLQLSVFPPPCMRVGAQKAS